jgi:heat shock protein HslJ
MRPLLKYSIHNGNKKFRLKLSFLAAGLLSCIVLFSCGEANSNNLPEKSDSSNLKEAPPIDSDINGNPVTSKLETQAMADTGKLAGIWFLVAGLPSDTANGKIPTINFDEGSHKFSGNTGCNNMRGNFSLTDNKLEIDEQIITTKMACPGYNEDAFLKSLPKANSFRFENGMLVLLSDQTELSRWSRKPVKPTTKTT